MRKIAALIVRCGSAYCRNVATDEVAGMPVCSHCAPICREALRDF